ncbi:MAG: aminoglycoside phosphotransferase family protein [Deltaproteobacteria bacterium]|nr:aminoglycoside phosphotransferase family protein [Deltaproteobacteria bacterium]
MAPSPRPPTAVLAAWGFGPGTTATRLTSGLINLSYHVQEGPRQVALQRLHPIFDARVNLDIDAITSHLEARGICTPRPVRTRHGELSFEEQSGSWRALRWIDGRVHERVESESLAGECGRLAGRFHAGLQGLVHVFEFRRPGAHDLTRHLDGLSRALSEFRAHPAHAAVHDLATQIVARATELPPAPPLPRRIVHGDLKITNLLFDPAERGLAVIDLDTLAHGRMDVELGDALRSWCNPGGEDDAHALFDAKLFAAALSGFRRGAGGLLLPAEAAAVTSATERISIELASRFARDALEERRFGWDRRRFESRSAHNLQRARGQLCLAASIHGQRATLEAIARDALAG